MVDKVAVDYRKKYGKDRHCGDPIATALKAFCSDDKGRLDTKKLMEVAKANDIDMSKYKHLNSGMQRMSLANRLRGLIAKGTDVKIGSSTIKGLPQTKTKPKAKSNPSEEVSRGVVA